jgi:hypothetical protein
LRFFLTIPSEPEVAAIERNRTFASNSRILASSTTCLNGRCPTRPAPFPVHTTLNKLLAGASGAATQSNAVRRFSTKPPVKIWPYERPPQVPNDDASPSVLTRSTLRNKWAMSSGMPYGGLQVDEESGAILKSDASAIPGLFGAGRSTAGMSSRIAFSVCHWATRSSLDGVRPIMRS